MNVPKIDDFPEGSIFYIKEFDIPLVRVPDGKSCKWFNWFGGKAKEYDVTYLKPGNSWVADSFESWQKILKDSMPL